MIQVWDGLIVPKFQELSSAKLQICLGNPAKLLNDC